jgi:SAM-dependent methyltransferase
MKNNHGRNCEAKVLSKDVFRDVLKIVEGLSQDDLDEMAVPTYTHPNPVARWIFWARHKAILSLANLGDDEVVLDFGTGTGALLPSLCAPGCKVLATDIRDQIARALVKHMALPVTFVDPHKLDDEIQDGTLTTIVAADVLEHVEEPELSEYFQVFHRKLTPSGKFIISIPTETPIYRMGRVLAGYSGKGAYHRTGIKELRAAGVATRFREGRVKRVPFAGLGCLFYVCCNMKAE